MTFQEYYKSKKISNSLLSTLTNPRFFKMKFENPDMEDDDKRHFRVGSALDCLLTDGDFHKEFLVTDIIRPYGFMSKFAESLPKGLSIQSPPESYVEAYQKAGYKMALDRVINNFWSNEEAVKYYQFLGAVSDNKRLLSKDEAESVFKAHELITANKFIKPYFKTIDPDIEILYQVALFWTYKEVECKGILDLVHIDHRTKKIQPIDLKTSGKSVYEFVEGSYLTYGYYRQAAFYDLAIRLSERFKDLLEQGYEIEPFLFVVVEVKPNTQHPCVGYRVTDISKGLTGFTDSAGNYRKGIDELIDAYK